MKPCALMLAPVGSWSLSMVARLAWRWTEDRGRREGGREGGGTSVGEDIILPQSPSPTQRQRWHGQPTHGQIGEGAACLISCTFIGIRTHVANLAEWSLSSPLD